MATDTTKSTDPKLVVAGVLAVVGWAVALYFIVATQQTEETLNRDITSLQSDIQAQQDAGETIGDLEAQIATLQPEVDTLNGTRLEIQTELDDLSRQVAAITEQKQSVDTAVAEQEQRLADLTAQADPLMAQIEGFDVQRQELQTEIEQQTAQLDETNTRLETARENEAALRDTMATLTEESARLADDIATFETSVQDLTTRKTDLEAQTETTQAALQDMQSQSEAITAELASMTSQRAALREDIDNARSQRDEIQAMVGALTANIEERSNILLDIENRIGAAHQNNSQSMVSDDDQTEAVSAPQADGLHQQTETHDTGGDTETDG